VSVADVPSVSGADDRFLAALRDDDPELLYDTAPCGYLSTDPDGLITKANATLLAMLGRRTSDVVGRLRFADLLTPGGRIYHETHYAPMLRMHDVVREIALDVVRADGSRLPVLVNAVLDREADGCPRTIRAAVFDATQRRAYERELQHEKERAEAAEVQAVALAQTLQQTLIPPLPPQLPMLDVGAVFLAGAGGVEVGGDFYDIFQVGADSWVVIIGDVVGKGIQAATDATLTRYTLRSMCVVHDSPADALRLTNDVLRAHSTSRFCSAVCLMLQPTDNGWHGLVSSAGHPLPLVRTADGVLRGVGRPGTLLNVLADPPLFDVAVDLQPGEALLLCTDGLPEGRRGRDFYGESRIAELFGSASGSAQQIAQSLLDDSIGFQRGQVRDDIAIVVLQVPAG
jgi:sigma-B regulation protein RsbU (phosphoserine phosphatase)